MAGGTAGGRPSELMAAHLASLIDDSPPPYRAVRRAASGAELAAQGDDDEPMAPSCASPLRDIGAPGDGAPRPRRCASDAGRTGLEDDGNAPTYAAALRRRYTEPLQPEQAQDTGTSAAARCGTGSALRPPLLRFGTAEDIGCRRAMEDRTIAVLDLAPALLAAGRGPPEGREELKSPLWAPSFFGVLDGHDGTNAAAFVQQRLLDNILREKCFEGDIPAALRAGFLETDRQYGAAVAAGEFEDAGTTALAALLWGRSIYVANLGDCRAVLSHRGRAVPLSRDQNPEDAGEKARVLRAGGYFCSDGRVCGLLTVTRCIGDWTLDYYDDAGQVGMLKSPGGGGVLSGEPVVTEHALHHDDEFLLMGCDGLWSVFGNQRAVEWARLRLQVHNNPQSCAEELVAEALKRNCTDNISVLVLCFQQNRPSRRFGGHGVRKCMSSNAVTRLAQFLVD